MIKTSSFANASLISAVFHIAAAAVLFSRPLHLNSRFFTQIGKTPSIFLEEENIAILKRNQALDEAFSYFETPPMGTPLSHSKVITAKELASGFETPPSLPPMALSLPEFEEMSLPTLPTPALKEEVIVLIGPPVSALKQPLMDPTIDQPTTEYIATYEVPIPAITSAAEEPSSFDFIPSQEFAQTLSLASTEMPSPSSVNGITPSLGAPVVSETPSEGIAGTSADFSIAPAAPKSIKGIRAAASLGEYGLPTLHLREWNEFFDVDVKTFPKEGGGFLFSININPKVDLSEYRLKQNYLFVIDRSNSVDKHRYQTAKRATSRAIAALRPGDFFNILILDSSITKFSETPLPISKAHLEKAEAFLEKQSRDSYGAASDIYTTLTKVLACEIKDDEAVAAILISDGESPLKSSHQRKKINSWLQANRDRITLYTATAGQGNNLSSLKMLSLASRGSLLYSDTHAAFPRKLAKLVMDIRYPIAKEMSASIILPEGTKDIELLPPSYRLPNLFSDHSYTLMGSAGQLTDFILVLEGKNKDQIFSIKKTISLSKAKQGSKLLLKEWDSEKAHTLFDQYLHEGDSALLQKAEKHDTQNSRR
jgi:hypothetical protein